MLIFLRNFSKKIGVDVLYLDDIDEDGCYLPAPNVIYIHPGLSEYEEIQVLSHELSHASKHKNFYNEYRDSYISHCKAENEADIEAVKTSLSHYLNNAQVTDRSQLNWIYFMDCYNIDYSLEPVVKKWMPIIYQQVY